MIALSLVLAVCTVLLLWAVTRLGVARKLHHGYYFGALAWLGVALGWEWLVIVGGVGQADDMLQHLIQLRWPGSRVSIAWWIYAHTFARWDWVKRLNVWLDGGE